MPVACTRHSCCEVELWETTFRTWFLRSCRWAMAICLSWPQTVLTAVLRTMSDSAHPPGRSRKKLWSAIGKEPMTRSCWWLVMHIHNNHKSAKANLQQLYVAALLDY